MLDKRAGLNLATDDVFVNVAGGMTIDEPAADLAIVAAVASSLRNRPIPPDVVVFGEVGLAGEVRADDAGGAARCARRRSSASRAASCRTATWRPATCRPGVAIVGVRTVGEALDALM